jgi:hypothetical protein
MGRSIRQITSRKVSKYRMSRVFNGNGRNFLPGPFYTELKEETKEDNASTLQIPLAGSFTPKIFFGFLSLSKIFLFGSLELELYSW